MADRKQSNQFMNGPALKAAPLLAAALLVAVTACGTKKKLDEMHGATVEMADTTKDMSKTTKEMRDTTKDMSKTTDKMSKTTDQLKTATDHLSATTCEMFEALKQGDSLAARRLGLAAAASSVDSARKISEAAKYFMSFEYQLWSVSACSSEKVRLEVAASAAREFFKDVQEFIVNGDLEPKPFARGNEGDSNHGLLGKILPLEKIAGSDNGNRVRTFNAIAVTLHLLNHRQETMLKEHPGIKELSMFTMIRDALAARAQIDGGERAIEDFPLYVKEVLTYEEIAVGLLQARYNFFGAMALGRISRLKEGTKEFLKMRVLGWQTDLSKYNTVELKEFTRYMKGALRAQEALQAAGLEAKMDANLKKMFDNMMIVNLSPAAGRADGDDKSVAVGGEKAAAEHEFVSYLEKYKGSPVQLKTEQKAAKPEAKGEKAPEAKN